MQQLSSRVVFFALDTSHFVETGGLSHPPTHKHTRGLVKNICVSVGVCMNSLVYRAERQDNIVVKVP